MTAPSRPLFFGVLDHARTMIPFTIHYNPDPSPTTTYLGHADYRGKRFILLGPDAGDCRLGLSLMLQEYDAKTPIPADC